MKKIANSIMSKQVISIKESEPLCCTLEVVLRNGKGSTKILFPETGIENDKIDFLSSFHQNNKKFAHICPKTLDKLAMIASIAYDLGIPISLLLQRTT